MVCFCLCRTLLVSTIKHVEISSRGGPLFPLSSQTTQILRVLYENAVLSEKTGPSEQRSAFDMLVCDVVDAPLRSLVDTYYSMHVTQCLTALVQHSQEIAMSQQQSQDPLLREICATLNVAVPHFSAEFVRNYITTMSLPFLRQCAILAHILLHAVPSQTSYSALHDYFSLSPVHLQKVETVPIPHPSTYSLTPLPETYDALFTNTICTNCNTAPSTPALCLICGTILCSQSFCCTVDDMGECSIHARSYFCLIQVWRRYWHLFADKEGNDIVAS